MSSMQAEQQPLLEVEGLKKFFPVKKGFAKRTVGYVKAVDNVTFSVNQGETFGVVGESGCGKTTTARLVMQAFPPTAGLVRLRRETGAMDDVTSLRGRDLHRFRREVQMVFQDPYASLNPRMSVRDLLTEPMVIHRIGNRVERERRAKEMLDLVGLQSEYLNRYPHAFSGGQRQRLGIARAIIMKPNLVVCDEPVSALDVSVQAQILNLLDELQRELGLTYVFIAHDLSVVRHICDRVAVMYVGKIVEMADVETLFTKPKHPYTEALLSSVPASNPDLKKKRIALEGEVADPGNPPSGCYFHPRCKYKVDRCVKEGPELAFEANDSTSGVRCHRAVELKLSGVPPIS